MDARQLKERLPQAVFAFRGYNITNLGRSAELLAHSMYGPLVRKCLLEASHVCADLIGRRVTLVSRVKRGQETTLKTYAEAVALIMAMERAHVELLREFYGIDLREAKYAMGYSLGEIAAVAACGVIDFGDALRVPVALAADSAALAEGVTLCVLFSRGGSLPIDSVRKLCLIINQENQGVIGVSASLSPNTLLLMGQGNTVDRFRARMRDVLPENTNLRKNSSHFPPMHTPITWLRNIPNRAAVLMQTLPGGFTAPQPPILSLVTGAASYNDYNAREILHQWIDHPQLLWDVVYETLTRGIETVVHVGPEPNIIPATYKRLRDNIQMETKGSIGMRALTAAVQRSWIQALLPERSALLRAPMVQQVVLEDWLLAQHPA